MDANLLFFVISLTITFVFALLNYDEMCLLCKALATFSALSTVYWFIQIAEYLDVTWIFATIIILGTVYLIPEYIKAYKEGKAHREKIAKHKRETTVHHFLVRDQEQE